MFSALIVYKLRYSSMLKIRGLYFVQFYYLMIVTPIMAMALINIGLDITNLPEINNFPVSTDVLFSLYLLSIIIGAIGSGIHSTSTSVAEAFKNKVTLNAYTINEGFHGPLSHELVFLATAFVTLFIGLLGINHPLPSFTNITFIIFVSFIIGIVNAVTVIRSTHIGISLITSFTTTLILLITILPISHQLQIYPYSILALTSAFTTFCLLLIASLIYATSKRISKVLIKACFPKGHPIHEVFQMM